MASSVAEIERELAQMRGAETAGGASYQRTSVMTHIAWVPEPWVGAAENVLAGLAERHPSRTIVLLPEADAGDQLDAEVEIDCFPVGANRSICTETVRIRLRGETLHAPASVVQPLLVSDLPVFLRWRGEPEWESEQFRQLIDVADRLIVDSTEWDGLPSPYARLCEIFDRVAVSDIAWTRTSRWRSQLASLWPEIEGVRQLRVTGTPAQALLLAGWLRSRLGHDVALEHEDSDRLVGVDVDGSPTPFPPGAAPDPADLLSEQLDQFSRDRVYEEAVRAAAQS
ncbi:MAG: glucose-6-phosphate dehydrogenase assembly protein OpcA [Gaiellaceae bacterium]|jgi:glucose-6-phosphate dehydrogenase assembly protein OpcA